MERKGGYGTVDLHLMNSEGFCIEHDLGCLIQYVGGNNNFTIKCGMREVRRELQVVTGRNDVPRKSIWLSKMGEVLFSICRTLVVNGPWWYYGK